jgi:hypothetical protein
VLTQSDDEQHFDSWLVQTKEAHWCNLIAMQ